MAGKKNKHLTDTELNWNLTEKISFVMALMFFFFVFFFTRVENKQKNSKFNEPEDFGLWAKRSACGLYLSGGEGFVLYQNGCVTDVTTGSASSWYTHDRSLFS